MSNTGERQHLVDLFAATFHRVARIENMAQSYIDSFATHPTPRGFRGTVTHEAASFLEHGTRRHWIEPVEKPALSWTKGGERFFSKGHFVSGITPRRILEKSGAEFARVVMRG